LIKIAPDKWKHFLAGILMGTTLQIITRFLMPEHFVMGIIITFILVIAISYGFELYSLITKKGHYEILDAVAAIIGGILGMAIILLIEYIY
jgi:ABC-type Fe3+-siderophore transport system permease subunit